MSALPRYLIALLLLGAFSGCTTRLIDFTVISSKNVTIGTNTDAIGERVEGKDQVYWFLTIPMGRPNIEEAVDRAIESAGPGYDALVDGVLYSYQKWYVLTGVSGVRVTGTPVKTAQLRASVDSGVEGAKYSSVLYHSSSGISNRQVVEEMDVIIEEID